jgi:hypothetical protein
VFYLGDEKMKKPLTLFVVCLIIISLSGCGSFNAAYDDDAKIAKSGDSNSTLSFGVTNIGHELSISSVTLTGTRTIWDYNAKSDGDVSISYLLSVSEGGKAKLVLITPDNEVVILVENADNTAVSEMQSQTVSLKQGKNRIKIVGYDAPKFELKLHIDVGYLEW